jgi:hypothetical protein
VQRYIHDQVIQFNIKILKTNKAIEIFGENIQKCQVQPHVIKTNLLLEARFYGN